MARKPTSRRRDEEAGFLDAIAAAPEDDAVRLIFADWMDERGDPRGAFIRLQVELARAPLDDPRRPEWEFRAHDLPDAGPLPALPRRASVTLPTLFLGSRLRRKRKAAMAGPKR
jgi:uncharacterized protein (TIGR02996 family)